MGIREGVRAGTGQLARSVRVDLRLDGARGSVVEAAEGGDQAAVLPRMADEDLAAGELTGRRLGAEAGDDAGGRGDVLGVFRLAAAEPDHWEALAAACATVSRSAKPSIRTTRSPGGRRTRTAGSWMTP